eukprot:5596483-Pleurochrysis_carterae.AAC.4
MVVGKERLKGILNLSCNYVAQVVDLKVLGNQVVEAQHAAEARRSRSWHLAQVRHWRCTRRTKEVPPRCGLLRGWFPCATYHASTTV